MNSLSVNMLSPTAVYLDEANVPGALAPRPSSLDGMVVALLPNWRPAGVDLLNAIGDALMVRFQLKGLLAEPPMRQPPVSKNKLLDGMSDQLDDLAGRADVVIAAIAD